MKKFYVDVRRFDKKIVTTAIESGSDALLANNSDIAAIKKLSVINVIAPKGDIVLGKDLLEIEINNRDEETKAMALAKKRKLIVKIKNWKIIPLEDLVASHPDNIFTYVKDSKEAKIALTVLEKGVAGIVLNTTSLNEIKKVAKVVKESSEKLKLVDRKSVV